MNNYYIKRFRYNNNNIYLDLYCSETNVNFELTFCHYSRIMQDYKEIINMLSHNLLHDIPVDIHRLIHILENRRKGV